MAPRAPSPAMAPTVFLRGMATGIAGAQVAPIVSGGGLAKMTGVESGVFVTTVPRGTPANQSGLTDGDVIVRAGAYVVRDVLELQELVGRASMNGERSLELEIVRDHKNQKITLRW